MQAPLFCDFLMDIFNMLSNVPQCANRLSKYHDSTLPRCSEEEQEGGQGETRGSRESEVAVKEILETKI